MEQEKKTALEIAGLLLQINAIKLNSKTPFTWASGLRSPIYCDNRQILSYPAVRREVSEGLAILVKKHFPEAEVIAGVATGAIAHGILVAERLDLPFVYVRSSPKGHGMGNQVEGKTMPGKKTVVIEDLISTAKSSMAAVNALREEGFNVLGMAAIFSYQMEAAEKNLKKHHCSAFTLSNYQMLLEKATLENIIDNGELNLLKSWRKDPENWA